MLPDQAERPVRAATVQQFGILFAEEDCFHEEQQQLSFGPPNVRIIGGRFRPSKQRAAAVAGPVVISTKV